MTDNIPEVQSIVDRKIEEVTADYNAAVANGLIMKARRLNRWLNSLEKRREREQNGL